MELNALGYVGIVTDKLDDWSDFAGGLLGMQVTERSRTSLALRMDDRKQRADRRSGPCQRLPILRLGTGRRRRARAHGRADRASRRRRHARAAGPRRPALRRRTRLVRGSGRQPARIVSWRDGPRMRPSNRGAASPASAPGPLGVGHVVLTSDDISALMPFYQNVLGFRLSDYTLRPFKAYFFHINARHHSFAIVETGKRGVHHLMVELFSLDDMGQGYDLAQRDPEKSA